MDTINVNLENLNEEERKLLMSLVEKGNAPRPTPKSKVWKPKDGEKIYLMRPNGTICSAVYHCIETCGDRIYDLGNLFPTEEAVKEEAKRRQILKRWKDLSIESGETENHWDCKSQHWFISCRVSSKQITYYSTAYEYYEGVFFASKESAEAAVKEIGEDNVKKYILNIKE